jgi:hypothetical protein
VDALGDVGLDDVDEHHHGAEEEPERLATVLAGAPGCRSVDRLEHGRARPMFDDPARPTEPAICAATSERMSP